jgi:hypothetical protein
MDNTMHTIFFTLLLCVVTPIMWGAEQKKRKKESAKKTVSFKKICLGCQEVSKLLAQRESLEKEIEKLKQAAFKKWVPHLVDEKDTLKSFSIRNYRMGSSDDCDASQVGQHSTIKEFLDIEGAAETLTLLSNSLQKQRRSSHRIK